MLTDSMGQEFGEGMAEKAYFYSAPEVLAARLKSWRLEASEG